MNEWMNEWSRPVCRRRRWVFDRGRRRHLDSVLDKSVCLSHENHRQRDAQTWHGHERSQAWYYSSRESDVCVRQTILHSLTFTNAMIIRCLQQYHLLLEVFMTPERTALGLLLLSLRGCLCGSLCVCHVDVLCPNDWVNHHATFTRL